MEAGAPVDVAGTVVVADDHPVVRGGLQALIERGGFRVVGEAGDVPQTVRQVRALRPDVLLADLHMPGGTIAELLSGVREAAPDTRVLVLTVDDSAAAVRTAMAAGATGYVLKDARPADLRRALESVRAGRPYLDPRLGGALLTAAGGPLAALSPEEIEVLRLLGLGHTAREIAAMLGVPQRHVEWMRTRIQRALGVDTRAGLVRIALQEGVLDPPPRR